VLPRHVPIGLLRCRKLTENRRGIRGPVGRGRLSADSFSNGPTVENRTNHRFFLRYGSKSFARLGFVLRDVQGHVKAP